MQAWTVDTFRGGGGMPGCPASDVRAQEREEAMRGSCNKHTGRLRLSK